MITSEVIKHLKHIGRIENIEFKEKKFGIISNNALGVFHKELKEIAKTLPQDDDFAIKLFDTHIYEARLLCSKIFKPKNLTVSLAEEWLITFENWEICDSFSMDIFAKSPIAVQLIMKWSNREQEFEKRACFATIAAYCMADKQANNEIYEAFFPLIVSAAIDERIYVKKAVNWALRSIGKRNNDLNKKAIKLAHEIQQIDSKSAKWIAKDALKELGGMKVNILDYPRAIYRPKN